MMTSKNDSTQEPDRALRCEALSVLRGGNPVLLGVSLELRPGQTVWLRGESGSGKTTFLKVLSRLVPWSAGEVTLDGVQAHQTPAHLWRRDVLFLAHPPIALAPTVAGDLLAPHRLRARRQGPAPHPAALEQELAILGLQEVSLSRRTSDLSQGQLARIALLRALLACPRYLLLDEPAANLDQDSSRRVRERVRGFVRGGAAVLVAAHAPPWEGVDRAYSIVGHELREDPR